MNISLLILTKGIVREVTGRNCMWYQYGRIHSCSRTTEKTKQNQKKKKQQQTLIDFFPIPSLIILNKKSKD